MSDETLTIAHTTEPETANLGRRRLRLCLNEKSYLLIVVLLWAAIYVRGMFTPALLDDADTVHAEAAREVLARNDWITLHANGVRYLEKAPFMYWCVALSYKLLGVSEWTTRLPLVLGVLALQLAVYALGKLAYGQRAGFYAALILGASLGPYLFTRFLIPDLLVALWLTLAIYLFLLCLGQATPSKLACWSFAAVCALNVLTKGLIGLAFPLATIALYVTLTGEVKRLATFWLISSSTIFVVVAAPWHILAAVRNPSQGNVPGFLWFYFVNEHFLRYINRRVPRDYDTVPLVLFWALPLVWLFPWSAFLPQALKNVVRGWRRIQSELNTRKRANLLFTLWAAAILVFFSFSTRQEYYTVPALPALALLVGGWLQDEGDSCPESSLRHAGRVSSAVLLAIGILIFVLGTTSALVNKTSAAGTDLSQLLTRNPQDYALSFGHILDLTPTSMAAFRAPLLGFAAALLAGTLANWLFRLQGRTGLGNIALVIMMVAALECIHSGFVIFSPILSSKPLAEAISREHRPGDVIVVDGEYESGSSVNFYTGLSVRVLHEPSANLWYGSQFGDAPHVFETPASFIRLWKSSSRVFLWTDQDRPKELDGLTFCVLARSGGKFILTNKELH